MLRPTDQNLRNLCWNKQACLTFLHLTHLKNEKVYDHQANPTHDMFDPIIIMTSLPAYQFRKLWYYSQLPWYMASTFNKIMSCVRKSKS